MKTLSSPLFCLVLWLCPLLLSGQLVIINGDFESDVLSASNDYLTIPEDATITGWNVVQTVVDNDYGVDLVGPSFFEIGYHTSQFIDLTARTSGSSLEQTFSGLAENTTYWLDFDYRAKVSSFQVDVQIVDGSGADLMSPFSVAPGIVMSAFEPYGGFSFTTGTGVNGTTATLKFSSPNDVSNNGMFIDNVHVIPEPSTYALIFGGLVLGVVIFRKKLRNRGQAPHTVDA